MGRDGKGWRRASDASYEVTFTYQGVRCRERIAIKPAPANDKKIANFLGAVRASIDAGTFDYAVTFPGSPRAARFALAKDDTKVEGFMLDWLDREKPHMSASNFRDYTRTINNHIIPALGNLRVAELEPRHVRDWLGRLSVSHKRKSNLLSPLRSALKDAVDIAQTLQRDPLAGLRLVRRDRAPKKDTIDPFTKSEQAAILKAADPAGQPMLRFAFWTGLRTSELCALEWADVSDKEVYVWQALTDAADEPETTKTPAGKRYITLLAPALAAIAAQRELSEKHTSGRVFLDIHTGEPWEGDQAIRKKLWIPAVEAAGVRYRRPYETRHTYASMMLSAGEPPRWVANQLGHSDLQMLFRVYGRWIPESIPDVGHKAVQAFADNDSEKTAEARND